MSAFSNSPLSHQSPPPHQSSPRSPPPPYSNQGEIEGIEGIVQPLKKKRKTNTTITAVPPPQPPTNPLKKHYTYPSWRKKAPEPSNLANFSDMTFQEYAKNRLIDQGWCLDEMYDNPTFIKKRKELGWDGQDTTLGLFTSGRFWFPHSYWEEFLLYYAMDYSRDKKPLYFNQRLGKQQALSKLVLDFDFRGNIIETSEYIYGTLQSIQKVLHRYYPNRDNPLLVFSSAPKRIDPVGLLKNCLSARKFRSVSSMEKNPLDGPLSLQEIIKNKKLNEKQRKYKMGLHIHAYDIVIKRSNAAQLVASIVAQLENDRGSRERELKEERNPWNKVVDSGPLQQGQLRLLGSRKVDDCVFCAQWDNDIREECPGCHGVGTCDGERVYKPLTLISGPLGEEKMETLKEICDDTYQLLQMCSLHVPGAGESEEKDQELETPWKIPPLEPQPLSTLEMKKMVYLNNSDEKKELCIRENEQVYQASLLVHKGAQKIYLQKDDIRWETLEMIIRTGTIVQYSQVRLNQVYTNIKNTYYVATLKMSVGCHYCQNVQRDHTSITVYFYFAYEKNSQRFKAYQKCWKRVEDSTSTVQCNSYQSPGFDISTFYSDILFKYEAKKGNHNPKKGTGALFKIPLK